MDVTTVAQDMLNLLLSSETKLADNLGEVDRVLKAQLEKMGQATLQLPMDLYQELGYQGASSACECGQKQRFVSHRPWMLKTVLSRSIARITIAPPGPGGAPYDQRAGSMALSPEVAKLACELFIDLAALRGFACFPDAIHHPEGTGSFLGYLG